MEGTSVVKVRFAIGEIDGEKIRSVLGFGATVLQLMPPFLVAGVVWNVGLPSSTQPTRSGSYPSGEQGLTQYAEEYFEETGRWDRTEDYRLTGVLDKDHFQAPKIHWNLKKLARLVMLFFLDPHHIHKWIDIKYDAWFNLYGEDAYAQRYDVAERYKKSFVILWWVLLKDRKIAAKAEK